MSGIISDKIKVAVFSVLGISFLFYTIVLYCDLPVKNTVVAKDASEGKKLWQEFNCGGCHQVYGLGGYLGPDLTNVFSLRGPDYIRAYITAGNRIMPAFRLPEKDMEHLISYLETLDASGVSDPRTFKITEAGNIEQ